MSAVTPMYASNLFKDIYLICGDPARADDVTKASGLGIYHIGAVEESPPFECQMATKKNYFLLLTELQTLSPNRTSLFTVDQEKKKQFLETIENITPIEHKGKHTFNNDFAYIPSVHPEVLMPWTGKSRKIKPTIRGSTSFHGLMTNTWSATFSDGLQDALRTKVLALSTILGGNWYKKTTLPKAIAVVKSALLTKVSGLKDVSTSAPLIGKLSSNQKSVVTFCFFGHWCSINDQMLHGEHVFGEAEIKTRIPTLDMTSVPKHFQTTDKAGIQVLNQLGWFYAYYDAKNIIPLCSDHNSAMGDMNFTQKISWLLSTTLYGEPFVDTYLRGRKGEGELNYQNHLLVPRTWQGYGFGDAMMYHLLWKHNDYILKGRFDLMIGVNWLIKGGDQDNEVIGEAVSSTSRQGGDLNKEFSIDRDQADHDDDDRSGTSRSSRSTFVRSYKSEPDLLGMKLKRRFARETIVKILGMNDDGSLSLTAESIRNLLNEFCEPPLAKKIIADLCAAEVDNPTSTNNENDHAAPPAPKKDSE